MKFRQTAKFTSWKGVSRLKNEDRLSVPLQKPMSLSDIHQGTALSLRSCRVRQKCWRCCASAAVSSLGEDNVSNWASMVPWYQAEKLKFVGFFSCKSQPGQLCHPQREAKQELCKYTLRQEDHTLVNHESLSGQKPLTKQHLRGDGELEPIPPGWPLSLIHSAEQPLSRKVGMCLPWVICGLASFHKRWKSHWFPLEKL